MLSRLELPELSAALLNLFFPLECGFCENMEEVEPRSFLCKGCRTAIREVQPPVCTVCGLPVPGLISADPGTCGQCMSSPPPYGRTRYGVYYEGAVREAVVRLKYEGRLYGIRPLSRLLIEAFARHFTSEQFDAIIPVPVHRSRLISRGFNQAVVLGKRLSKQTGIPLDRTSLQKTRRTPPQVGLPRERRLKNVRGSFGIAGTNKVKARRILLVDDVATTGTTIVEASKALLRGGADRVDALVLCLSLGPRSRFAHELLGDQGKRESKPE